MAEFRPVNGLNELAARLVVDQVKRAATELQDAAKVNAPPSKTWVTVLDDAVRPSHRKVHGQEVPENVRFQVPTPEWDRKHRDPDPYQLMRYPHDEENATVGNLIHCRCVTHSDPEGVSRHITASDATQDGTKVTAEVTAKFNRIEESEYGANGEVGLRFMGRALTEVSGRYRGR